MKNFIYLCVILVASCSLMSCDNDSFIDDIFVQPKAKFSIEDKAVFQVFESVHFINRGVGQRFTVWPGDQNHVYNQKSNTGYACNTDGTFSYSYQEPGEYNAVWIASSVKADGTVILSVDSVTIRVEATAGGLLSFSLPRMGKLNDFGSSFFYESYGKFVEKNRIICPIPYSFWPNYIRRTVGVKFELGSSFAKLNWMGEIEDVELTSESPTKVLRFDQDSQLQPQILKVVSSSGKFDNYEVVAMIIPEFSTFTINGVAGKVSRDLSAFNKFKVNIKLPTGVDKTSLAPIFEVFKNDANLLNADKTMRVSVDAIEQTSNVTRVDFSKSVNYVLTYTVAGSENYKYSYDSYYEVTVE